MSRRFEDERGQSPGDAPALTPRSTRYSGITGTQMSTTHKPCGWVVGSL